jgi:hypothetical protein
MTSCEVLERVVALLQRHGRVTYRQPLLSHHRAPPTAPTVVEP